MKAAPVELGMLSPEHSQLLDLYLDSIWMERGLSRNTLESYGRDLEAGRHIALPAPLAGVHTSGNAAQKALPPASEPPKAVTEPPADYVRDGSYDD